MTVSLSTLNDTKVTMDDYIVHHIPKRPKPGQPRRYRILHEPREELKSIQAYIAQTLMACGLGASPYSYAYRKGVGLRDMAQKHIGATYALKMDMKDFFPSIKRELLHKAFTYSARRRITNESPVSIEHMLKFGFLPSEGGLPQGSPMSPILSNIAMFDTDMRIAKYLEAVVGNPMNRSAKRGSRYQINNNFNRAPITYTRYADDLTFSSTEDHVLSIAGNISRMVEFSSSSAARFYRNYSGLTIAPEKTVKVRKGNRIEVCGVVVNEKPNATKTYRNQVRNDVHRAVRDVIAGRCEPGFQLNNGEPEPIDVASLYGKISHIQYLNPDLPFKSLGSILLEVHGKDRDKWSYETRNYLQPKNTQPK